jgi:hypothetical protein
MFSVISETPRFYWLCIKDAWRGSWGSANSWAALLGAVVLWLGAELMGYQVILPSTFAGTIFLFVLCLFAAWAVIFVARLIYAPVRLHESSQIKIRGLSAHVQFGLDVTGEVEDQFLTGGKRLDGRLHIKNVSSGPIEFGPANLTAAFNGGAPKLVIGNGILRTGEQIHYKFEFDELAAAEGSNSVTFTASIHYGPPGRRVRKLQRTIEVQYFVKNGISYPKGTFIRADQESMLNEADSK